MDSGKYSLLLTSCKIGYIMLKKILIEEFLKTAEQTPIIDVRSPAEFDQGHIPGAFNIPLFDNEERAKVGTRFKQAGNEFAVQLGLEIVGPKLSDYTKQAKKLSRNKKLLVHCWRGGMRSSSMAWLFEITGLKTEVLIGGYKAYRAYIREQLGVEVPLKILGGFTGSGKTEILYELAKRGDQMIDLEGIAHHKGSAFGTIGQLPQPTNEQFENNLAAEWLKLDFSKPVWLEDESVTMGRCGIPSPLYNRMRKARVYNVIVPKYLRERRLVKEYANGDMIGLEKALERISRKLGGLRAKEALDALRQNDFLKVAEISLVYYDKAYGYGIDKREQAMVKRIEVDSDEPAKTAEMLLSEK